MQAHTANQMPSVKCGYLDPQLICQSRFTYARNWELDSKHLAARTTVEEKEKIRARELKTAGLKVAAYISLAFKNLQKKQ